MSKVSPSSSPADGLVSSSPISLQEVHALAQVLNDYGLSELELTRAGGDHLRLRRDPAPSVAAASPAPGPLSGGSVSAMVHPGHGQPASRGHDAAQPSSAGAGPSREKANLVAVTSPLVGTFYRSANPDAPVFAEVGQRVRKGQTLCIIEAMKLMNELEADVDGVVAECVAQNGRPVEYGQLLFQIDVG